MNLSKTVILQLTDESGCTERHELSLNLPKCPEDGGQWVGVQFIAFGPREVKMAPVSPITMDDVAERIQALSRALATGTNCVSTLPELQKQIDANRGYVDSALVDVYKRLDAAEKNLTDHEQKLGHIMYGHEEAAIK